MKQHYLLFLILSAFTLFTGCQKEISFNSLDSVSVGSLQSAGGDCLPKTVGGTYVAGTALVAANNYIEVQVNVTTPGSYVIYTDTVNGIYFRVTGAFNNAGTNTIRLRGVGTPVAAATSNFNVHYGATTCMVPVTITAAGGGGGGAAVYSLDGSPNVCMTYVVHGTYTASTAVDATDKVDIKVTVTTIGTYTITTVATNGLTFSATGTFTATGAQTITLAAAGTPVASGTTTIPVTAGTTSCNFPVTVNPAAPPTPDYFPRTTNSNWSYEVNDDVNDSLLRKVIAPTHIVSGNPFNIFMATDNAANGFDSSGYYRRSGGDYFEFVDMGALYGFDNSFWVEYTFLKDNVAQGTAWQSASYVGMVGAQSLTFRLNYKIGQKDVDVVVNGTTYPNTIVVEERVDVFTGGVWVDATSQIGYYKTYYSRNIGMIKQESYDLTGAVDGQIEMRRYQIQ